MSLKMFLTKLFSISGCCTYLRKNACNIHYIYNNDIKSSSCLHGIYLLYISHLFQGLWKVNDIFISRHVTSLPTTTYHWS